MVFFFIKKRIVRGYINFVMDNIRCSIFIFYQLIVGYLISLTGIVLNILVF